MRFPVPGFRFPVLAAILFVATTAAAQGRFTNARTETRAAGQGSDAIAREVRALASRAGAAWIGYAVPMVGSRERHMCCSDNGFDSRGLGGCCGMCRLENGGGMTMSDRLQNRDGSRIVLEPPSEFLVLARVENGSVMRLRTFTPDCDVDAGNMPIVWLTGVRPEDSVAWLSDLVRTAGRDGNDRRVGDPALTALSLHGVPGALTALIDFAKNAASTRLRGQALFWLAQRAGEQAAATITNAITNDPDTDVKKKAVFALSQMPKDEGIPKLIEVARTNRNPEVRKQAYFWLGQTHDPRAVAFFEEILGRRR